jgi:hypothetical protein
MGKYYLRGLAIPSGGYPAIPFGCWLLVRLGCWGNGVLG